MVELLAIAPAGEVYFTRDRDGRRWRHHQYLPGNPVEVGEAEVAFAVSRHEFVSVDEAFDSWVALATAVRERTPKANVDPAQLAVGPTAARAALRILPEWQSDPARAGLVPRVVGRLLESPAVRADEGLANALTAILQAPSATPAVRLVSNPGNGRRSDQMQQYFKLAA